MTSLVSAVAFASDLDLALVHGSTITVRNHHATEIILLISAAESRSASSAENIRHVSQWQFR